MRWNTGRLAIICILNGPILYEQHPAREHIPSPSSILLQTHLTPSSPGELDNSSLENLRAQRNTHIYSPSITYRQAPPTHNLQLRSPRIRYLRKASHMKKWSQTKPIKKELRDNSKMKILWQSRHHNGPERDLICPVVVVFSWKKSCKYLCF